jgi:Signal peptidase, peptidase S26
VKRFVVPGVLVLLVAGGCASKSSAPGSVPVKTVQLPSTTETLAQESSSMEPTIHCPRPGRGCEADIGDGVVVREPASSIRRADIIAFRTPSLASAKCGASGTFVKRVIGVPGDVWEERSGYVYIDGKKLNEPYVHRTRGRAVGGRAVVAAGTGCRRVA